MHKSSNVIEINSKELFLERISNAVLKNSILSVEAEREVINIFNEIIGIKKISLLKCEKFSHADSFLVWLTNMNENNIRKYHKYILECIKFLKNHQERDLKIFFLKEEKLEILILPVWNGMKLEGIWLFSSENITIDHYKNYIVNIGIYLLKMKKHSTYLDNINIKNDIEGDMFLKFFNHTSSYAFLKLNSQGELELVKCKNASILKKWGMYPKVYWKHFLKNETSRKNWKIGLRKANCEKPYKINIIEDNFECEAYILKHSEDLFYIWIEIDDKKDTKIVKEEQLSIFSNKIHKSQLEVKESLEQIEYLNDYEGVRKQLSALNGMISKMAHQINTPLGVQTTGVSYIVQKTNKILKEIDKSNLNYDYFKAVYKMGNILMESIESQKKLVDDFKKIFEIMNTTNYKKVNIEEFFINIFKFLLNKYLEYNIEYQVKSEIKELYIYPELITDMISRFLDNTIKHGYALEANVKIKLNITKENNKIILCYRDYGKGISKDKMDEICNIHSGLSLNLVKNYIEQKLIGEMVIDSIQNKYTEIKIIWNY